MLSKISQERLNTCHPDLIKLMTAVSEVVSIAILCGHRGEAEQNKAFAEKKSKLKFPQSKHNKTPSLAVDIAPLPINWNDADAFKSLANLVFEIADRQKIVIRWGGDFNQDGSKTKNDAWDLPHYELVGGK